MGKPKRMIPEWVWDLFEEYVAEVKSKPFVVKDWVGAAAKPVEREKEKPLTMEGFNNFLYSKGWMSGIADYWYNRNAKYNDYIPVMNRIKSVIRQDQIEGGMAMIYNPSITQRLNNLVEKSEVKVDDVTVTMKL